MLNKKLLAVFAAAVLLIATAIPALAATEGSVTATVTAQNISITVSDGTVAYGTLDANTTRSTALGDGDVLDDTQTATNNGNVNEDFNIKGQNSVNWTLAATAGADQYAHKYCKTTCDITPTWTALTTPGYQSLTTGVAASGGTQAFDLQITTPTSSTNFTPQSVDVTVQAVAS